MLKAALLERAASDRSLVAFGGSGPSRPVAQRVAAMTCPFRSVVGLKMQGDSSDLFYIFAFGLHAHKLARVWEEKYLSCVLLSTEWSASVPV